jgi:predicted nucleotidyltransferase
MTYPTVFHLISAIEKKEGVSCILIGGFAVNYHKFMRQTMDVDFAIVKEDFHKFSEALKKAGFKIDFIHDTFVRFKANDYYLADIDFMFVDKETFDKMVKDAKMITIADQKIMVPSLSTLLAMKLHAIKSNRKAREYKDLLDILSLIRANNVNYKSKEFKELCLKFGTEKLYKKIINLM